MENRNILSPRADIRDALICGIIIGVVIMGMTSWLIGAALVGAAGHGDWIISAWDALQWMLIIWIFGCGQGFYGGWWYHYRLPPVRDETKKKKATRSAATEASGKPQKSPSLYAGKRRKSRRNRDVECNNHRRVAVC